MRRGILHALLVALFLLAGVSPLFAAPSAPAIGTPTLPTSAPYDTQFTAVWGSVFGATGYRLDVATDSGFTSFVSGYNDKGLGAVTSSAVTGLAPGTKYYYRVRATGFTGTSANSGTASITTYASAPVALPATNVSASGLTVNWNAAAGASSYLLYGGTTSGGTDVANGIAVSGTSLSVASGLNPGVTYYYWLRSVNAAGSVNPTSPSTSPAANVIAATLIPATPTPGGRTTSTSTTVTVTWSASTGATGYYLDVATDSAFTNLVLNNLSVGNVTSYAITVATGTDYYYRVRAANASGTSAYSAGVFVDFTVPTLLGLTAGTGSADASPVDLTLSALGGPYVKTTTPFFTASFSEPVLGIAYGTSITLKNALGTTLAVAAGYTPANSTTATPAGSPSVATFQPSAALTNGVKYSLTITGGTTATTIHDNLSATAANNNPLTSPPVFYFTVDTTAPTVSSVTPASGATGVGVTQPITVVFNENCQMDNRSFNQFNIQLADSAGNAVPVLISSPVKPYTTLTITPATELAASTTYTLTLSNIKDAAGNLLSGTGSYSMSFSTKAASVSSYSMNPAYLATTVVPNVLIILDNSNSMDESLATGDGIGSFNCTDSSDLNSCSRSILARQALINLVNTYAGKINIGLMAYDLPSDTSKSMYLYNTFYFASYDPRTYCGINPPPAACYNYCVNEDAASLAACESACQGDDPAFLGQGYTFNPLFQASLRDPILTNVANGSSAGSDKRKNYCNLIYPKTVSLYNSANKVTIYHATPGTLYDASATNGTIFGYSGSPPGNAGQAYSPSETASNTYYLYRNRAAASAPPFDGYVGYSNLSGTSSFVPTDDDKALGFNNFGQAMMWYPPYNGSPSPTWYSNKPAPSAGGFLHVPVAANGSDNVQLNKLLAKLGPNGFKNDAAGYLACSQTGNSADRCSYIVNAGLTPTAGTLQSAIDYLNGNLTPAQTQDNAKPASPIQYGCQKTFIIYVTDGLASVDVNGKNKDSGGNFLTAASLVNRNSSHTGVLDKLDNLRCPAVPGGTNCQVAQTIGGTSYKFDVQTYVLGLAISPQASPLLDAMAVAGGADNKGKAYYANDATALNNALVDIFQNILSKLSSGTSASMLNNFSGTGASLLQALFYPEQTFENLTSVKWSGELYNLWYYVDPFISQSAIYEDSDADRRFDISADKKVQFYYDTSLKETKVRRYNLDGSTSIARLDPDVNGGLQSLWAAGKLLWRREPGSDPRRIYTSVDGRNLIDFSDANAATLVPEMQVSGTTSSQQTAAATRIIDFVQGTDVCLDGSSPCGNKSRNRTVTIPVSANGDAETHVWKLGDIISSTPRLQGGYPLHSYDQAPPAGYSDQSYPLYYGTGQYQRRGMVYVGSNDGMLHAFKLGNLNVKGAGSQKASLSGTNLGREEWAYIPRSVLPYLNYLADPNYDKNHLYLMDGSIHLFDVATKTTTARDDYWNQTRSGSSWKTVLLGGMGLGGASRSQSASCVDQVAAGSCVKAPIGSRGYSSYFALDISNQDFNADSGNALRAQPTLMWEFSHPELGFATSGPALIRLNAKGGANTPDATANGRWFAVFASGPTGPIDTGTRQFKGKSDQNLKLFVVDLEKGPVVDADPKKNGLWIIDTGIANAFAGNIGNNAVVDAEITTATDANLRQDDALYIGYTKLAADGTWTDGGVLRLTIPDAANPDLMDLSAWKTSRVVDGIGPVTSTVTKLISKNNLYLFFGTGRYFYPLDDMSSTRRLFMVKEKCYPVRDNGGNYLKSDLIDACSESNAATPVLHLGDLTSRTTASSSAVTNGWFIDLDAGERVVTDPTATVNGAVYFTTYKPSGDACAVGGSSFLWGVKYDTAEALPQSARQGKMVVQLSTGSFAEIDLATALGDKGGRRTGDAAYYQQQGTAASDLTYGMASTDNPLLLSKAGLSPVRRILHIQERYR